ncbi:MAG: TetR/AcrR family transcriptional regulator [Methylophilus sp.]|nr:TetR/AcrR family transcriptional regulator [Methylophilus sp.]
MTEKRSRKRRAIERRLDEILLIAETIISKKGIKELTLQEVISKSSISRGTFYKLFPSKETLITYLGIKGLNYWSALMEKAAEYDALSREKLLILYATHVLCNRLEPIYYKCIFIANAEVNRMAVDVELNAILDDRINNLISFIEECIHLAIKEGNLKMPPNLSTLEMAFFIWANRYGATIAAYNYQMSSVDLTLKYKIYTDYSLDNMQWRPLSTEINYERVLRNIFNTFYKKEKNIVKKIHPEAQPFSITEQSFDEDLPTEA